MVTRESSDYYLECARQLHKLQIILSGIREARDKSMNKAFSEWVGEAKDEMSARHDKDNDLSTEAKEWLCEEETKWVNMWVNSVDNHNTSVRRDEIESLQNALDLYHAEVVLKQGLPGNVGNVIHRGADELVDRLPGNWSIRADDADHPDLVPIPLRIDEAGWRPTPPHYVLGSVFVGYRRWHTADPTLGLEVNYSDRPG